MPVNLKNERLKRGWTQRDIAERVSTTKSGYANIERGTRGPSTEVFLKLMDIFGKKVPRLDFGKSGAGTASVLQKEYTTRIPDETRKSGKTLQKISS
ncbi:MAG: helix-turn-helix transcriptional regulator [Clostridiales Family XIII bacterium]|jgi:transcriptional regulator with XRE-family HTH domain|nr:helix-turn-helix transcriptional regulator [Clostridiales Family XIII bacterium]